MSIKRTPPREKLLEIAREIPTPYYLYDEAAIRAHARRLNRAFAWSAGFREYYAVKANPNPMVLKILKDEGCGVDCASYTELMLAEACGFMGDEIMFSSNTTPAAEYAYARALSANINLDDITHIDFLKENGGIPEFVCLRYNPGVDLHVANGVMGHPGEAKFGCTREQIFQGVEKLMGLGAKRFGLHAFLISNALGEEYYPAKARMLMELAVELYERLGARVELINLSGGVGIPYLPEQEGPNLELIGERVRMAYEEIVAPSGLRAVRMATELGRYITGESGWLVSTAIHEKNTYKHFIGLDACAVDLIRPAMYGAYHHITVPGKEDWPCDHLYDVVGSLCENNDKFAVDRKLPRIEMGDLVVLHDAGAHCHSMGYNYNGKLRPPEVLLREDGSHQLIRRRETPRDYFATLDFTGVMDAVLEKRG